jgi:SAM-dependent methyltransferase
MLLSAPVHRCCILLIAGLFTHNPVWSAQDDENGPAAQAYVLTAASRDGIGKRYMGREISHVMGHRGAGWLERDSREREERTDLLVQALRLRPTDVVADIGAGTGYFAFRISKLLPDGKVMAVDIQPQMLDIIARRATKDQDNVMPVLGSITDINLPENSLDLILLVDAYHEFSHPREMGESMFRALRPGGRLALVEYRAEDLSVAIKPLHKMTEEQAIAEMTALGFTWLETRDVLPQQHLLFFQKPAGSD